MYRIVLSGSGEGIFEFRKVFRAIHRARKNARNNEKASKFKL